MEEVKCSNCPKLSRKNISVGEGGPCSFLWQIAKRLRESSLHQDIFIFRHKITLDPLIPANLLRRIKYYSLPGFWYKLSLPNIAALFEYFLILIYLLSDSDLFAESQRKNTTIPCQVCHVYMAIRENWYTYRDTRWINLIKFRPLSQS